MTQAFSHQRSAFSTAPLEIEAESFIRVTSFPQSKEARAEIAEGITEVMHRATKLPKEYIWVVFEPMPQESWSVGGRLVSEAK